MELEMESERNNTIPNIILSKVPLMIIISLGIPKTKLKSLESNF